ncbi:MAG: Rrf2 family transcriptional regulator [Planctomycetota bacterium]
MKFTAQEEYGLRCLLQMARQEAKGSVTISEIAEAEGLTPAYVAKFMALLRQKGLVTSTRGQSGGYRLAKPAAETLVGDVLAALGGEIYSEHYCGKYTGLAPFCVHTVDCSIRSLLSGLQRLVGKVLGRTTLKDLACSETAMESWVRTHLPPPVEAGMLEAACAGCAHVQSPGSLPFESRLASAGTLPFEVRPPAEAPCPEGGLP